MDERKNDRVDNASCCFLVREIVGTSSAAAVAQRHPLWQPVQYVQAGKCVDVQVVLADWVEHRARG